MCEPRFTTVDITVVWTGPAFPELQCVVAVYSRVPSLDDLNVNGGGGGKEELTAKKSRVFDLFKMLCSGSVKLLLLKMKNFSNEKPLSYYNVTDVIIIYNLFNIYN